MKTRKRIIETITTDEFSSLSALLHYIANMADERSNELKNIQFKFNLYERDKGWTADVIFEYPEE